MSPPREPDGKSNRRRIMVAVPDLNAILMEVYVNPTERVPGVDREQQMWTYRYSNGSPPSREELKPRKEPRLVEDVVASVISPREVQLTWAAVKDAAG